MCANVDVMCYVVNEHADGSVDAMQINPDRPDLTAKAFDEELADHIDQVLHSSGLEVTRRQLAGDCAHALGRLAEILEAEMVVVGSRKHGLRSSVQEYLGGSVAVHLAHRQHRCLVVVPLSPVPAG